MSTIGMDLNLTGFHEYKNPTIARIKPKKKTSELIKDNKNKPDKNSSKLIT
jgi:hypothetical protein